MEFNKNTYLIIGGILILAYVVFKKKTYIVETTPVIEPSKPIEQIKEVEETVIKPLPISKPVVAQINKKAMNIPKSYSPDVRPPEMPQIQSMRPSFGQYGKKI
jgi:hypothetical protein